MVNNKVVAIIPARAGSKRIPKKNIKLFNGKPLLAWTIEAALAAKVFSEVIVSTDCSEIADIAKQFGAKVPFLRDNYADDHSTVSEVTLYVLDQLKSQTGQEYQTVVQLMANCPLRNEFTIRQALENFYAKNSESQISCFPFGWNNPWWAITLDENSKGKQLFPHALKTRSQDLPPLYCPTGAIWIAKTEPLYKHKSFYTPDVNYYPIPWNQAVDIDTLEDWQFAEALITSA